MTKLQHHNFTSIYNSYYKKSYYFAKSYVHDEIAAEEIASESLIKVWEKVKAEEIDYLQPLLLTIIKNKALDYLKHEEVKRSAFEHIGDWQTQELQLRITSLEGCNPNDLFSAEEEKILHSTLKKLPEKTEEIFILRRFENKCNKEIAASTGLSEKSVEYHITKALKVLRVALRDYLPMTLLAFYI